MKPIYTIAFLLSFGLVIMAQQQGNRMGTSLPDENTNLPVQKVGVDDLLGISVYDAPELTRSVRVDTQGMIRLPLLKHQVKAAGLLPSEVEAALVGVLKNEDILVNPIVTVSVIQYRSRPINVAGEVKEPVTFQASGTVTLLDALARAGGISESAGPEILVTRSGASREGRQDQVTEHIPVRQLIAGDNPKLNLRLEGGEDIRVPEAGLVYVVGSFHKPGVFKIQQDSALSVMEALALAEGLTPFAMKSAYIFRQSGSGRKEIPVQLNKIMERKAPDVSLQGNDIFYVPDNKSRRRLASALDKAVMLSGSLGAAVIYSAR